MSVGFFDCDACGETICDCGDYERCKGECSRRWCNRKCAEVDGADEDGICKYCRDEDIEDRPLLEFLLQLFKMTEKEAKELYFASEERT